MDTARIMYDMYYEETNIQVEFQHQIYLYALLLSRGHLKLVFTTIHSEFSINHFHTTQW
jgi:hypothetical protein